MRCAEPLIACALAAVCGCTTVIKIVAPSNVRSWELDQAVLPYAEFRGDQIVAHNVRHCRYMDADTFVVDFQDRLYDLSHLQAVDFFVVPFEGMPRLAHTMLSFEFAPPDGPPQYLAVSIEIRKEQ